MKTQLTDFDKAVLRLLAEGGMMHASEVAERLGGTEDDVCASLSRLQDVGFAEFHPFDEHVN